MHPTKLIIQTALFHSFCPSKVDIPELISHGLSKKQASFLVKTTNALQVYKLEDGRLLVCTVHSDRKGKGQHIITPQVTKDEWDSVEVPTIMRKAYKTRFGGQMSVEEEVISIQGIGGELYLLKKSKVDVQKVFAKRGKRLPQQSTSEKGRDILRGYIQLALKSPEIEVEMFLPALVGAGSASFGEGKLSIESHEFSIPAAKKGGRMHASLLKAILKKGDIIQQFKCDEGLPFEGVLINKELLYFQAKK